MKKHMLLAVLLTAFLALTASGQTTSATQGSLTGVVTDPGGATVVGAAVTLKNNATSAERTSTTDDRGGFGFAMLDPGIYTVTVEAQNFKKSVATNITVDVSRQSAITVALEIGSVSESVTVNA